MSRFGNQVNKTIWIGFLISLFIFSLNSCSNAAPSNSLPAYSTPQVEASHTWTPAPPTSTPVPMAAMVNAEGISLTRYQAELARFQAAFGTELATEQKQQVLDNLIDESLLVQAADQAGFTVDDQMIDERVEKLIAQLKQPQDFDTWLADNNYDLPAFREQLDRSIVADWMRDQIIAQVPLATEQVHARQILLYNSDQAEQVINELESGNDFATLAARYDPVTYGELGWFPLGYLLDTQLEQVIFALSPGEYSEIVQTEAGFHIVQLIEKNDQQPLEPDALLTLQMLALENWLREQREQSQIQILISE